MADSVSTPSRRFPWARTRRQSPALVHGRTARRREAITGISFIAPSMLGLIVFVLGPLLAVIYFSFTDYSIISPPRFVGFDNYVRLFSDGRLRVVAVNTLIYVVAAVVLINGLALFFAALVTQRMPRVLALFFRSVYFFPSLVALVYVSLIWKALFQSDIGIVNYYLHGLTGHSISWLDSGSQARWSVVIVDVWRNLGFAMLVFVAALQEVPRELDEAAQIDRAGAFARFRHVTVPMISQAIFFNITITIIGAFQIFDSIIVLTRGGPGDSTRSVVMYIAERAFGDFQLGYASAVSVMLFLVILLVTIVQFRVRRSWVHYE